MLKYLLILFLVFTSAPVIMAQSGTNQATVQAATESGSSDVEMADALRRDGKIYVVVAVIVTVLAGLIFYLIRLDRKVSRLEEQFKS